MSGTQNTHARSCSGRDRGPSRSGPISWPRGADDGRGFEKRSRIPRDRHRLSPGLRPSPCDAARGRAAERAPARQPIEGPAESRASTSRRGPSVAASGHLDLEDRRQLALPQPSAAPAAAVGSSRENFAMGRTSSPSKFDRSCGASRSRGVTVARQRSGRSATVSVSRPRVPCRRPRSLSASLLRDLSSLARPEFRVRRLPPERPSRWLPLAARLRLPRVAALPDRRHSVPR